MIVLWRSVGAWTHLVTLWFWEAMVSLSIISVSLLMMPPCIYHMLSGNVPRIELSCLKLIAFADDLCWYYLEFRAEEHLPNTLRQALIYNVTILLFPNLLSSLSVDLLTLTSIKILGDLNILLDLRPLDFQCLLLHMFHWF